MIEKMLSAKQQGPFSIQGVPVKCLDLARIFLTCGGKEELIKIIVDLEDFGS